MKLIWFAPRIWEAWVQNCLSAGPEDGKEGPWGLTEKNTFQGAVLHCCQEHEL